MSRSRLARAVTVLTALAALLALGAGTALAAHVDHALEARFDGSDTPGGPFQIVFGVETDNSAGPSDGDAYVGEVRFSPTAERYLGTVHKFDEDGHYAGLTLDGSNTPQGSFSFVAAETFALAIDGVAVDSSGGGAGDLYVADIDHGVVDKFDEDGNYLCQISGAATPSAGECAGPAGSEIPAGGLTPTGLAVDEAGGALYVADAERKAIYKFDSSGAFVSQIADPSLTRPGAIDLDSSGNLYVLNGELFGGENVVKFDSSGAFVSVFNADGPSALAVDRASGNVYLGRSSESGGITEYDPAGNPLESFAELAETSYVSLAVNASSGRLYAGNFGFLSGTVDIYSPDTVVPDVSFETPTDADETSVTLSGEVDPDGGGDVISCRFEYGTTTAYQQSLPCSPAPPYAGPTAVTATLSGLTPSTTYHVRLAAANAGAGPYTRGVAAHSADTLVVTTGAPTIEDVSAGEIERTFATLRAKINPHGFDTEFRFEFVDEQHFEQDGYDGAATRSTPLSQLGDGLKPLAVNQAIAGLAVGTTYHYRAVATNERGTATGPDQTFATRPVTATGRQWAYAHVKTATAEARINPLGLATTCRVEYVDEATFQQSGYAGAESEPCVAGLGSGSDDVTAKAELKGLELSTKYHFRFVTTNQSGTLAGEDESFETFGFSSFSVEVVDEEGKPYTQAGGHPYARITHYGFKHNFVPNGESSGGSLDAFVKSLVTEQARGQSAGDTRDVPKCPGYKADEEACDAASQVGSITVEYFDGDGISTRTRPLFDVVAPKGVATRYASVDPYTVTDSHVRTGSDYGTSGNGVNVTEEARVVGATVEIWGVPADHNGSGAARTPNLRNPTSCEGPQKVSVRANSWQLPAEFTAASTDVAATTGCDKLEFHPSIEWRPTTNVADSPTGLHVDVHQPQAKDPDQLAFADLRDAVMSPAEGLVLNPAGAAGLVGCSPAEIGLHEETPSRCPDASKVGTAEIDSPLVDHPLRGGIYIATPHDNPFGSMFAIYVAVDDARTGVSVKLAGNIQPDSGDGQLTSHFAETPQLPVEDFKLDFFGGSRSVLRTPPHCGSFVTESTLTPWSAPQSGPPAHPTDSYEITAGPNGGPCPSGEADAPKALEFRAGTTRPVAGAYAPFVMLLRREDGSQRIANLRVTPPPGLLGRLAGLPRCPEAAIVGAEARSGAAERANPSCPAGAEVGSVTIGAGAGSDPYYVSGKAYVGGPYRGAPLSLAIVVPAVAGPFDLGTAVVRTPLRIDLESGQVKVESDPIPTILGGVSLDVRTIAVKLDRPGFTLNPTSCDPAAKTTAGVTSPAGLLLTLEDPFRLARCGRLGFAPKVGMRLFGKTNRRGHPALRAVLTMPRGGANIARVAVAMPPTEFLDQEHIRGVCTRAQFALGECPANSVYGRAVAWTPLLDKPLSGPVIMRSSVHRLPDLVSELNGEFRLALAGRIGTAHGGMQANVDGLPDAPVSKFVMTMLGGSRGLLQNSVDACREPQRAVIELEAQNGKTAVLRPLLRANCPASAAASTAAGSARARLPRRAR